MIAAASAILCSPDFLYLDSQLGPLPELALHQRLAYFLRNGPPQIESSTRRDQEPSVAISHTVDRMLDDSRRERFVNAFLDYWLDLRDINANTPDAELYPEY